MIKWRKKHILDTAIIVLIFSQLVILNYFGLFAICNKILFCLISIKFILSIKNKKVQTVLFFYTGIWGLILIFSYLSASSGINNHFQIYKSNMVMALYTTMPVAYIAVLTKTDFMWLKTVFDQSFWVFNGYYVVNTIIVIIQIIRPYSFMRLTEYSSPMYEDLISGLMGDSAVHQLCLFTVFIILYNLYYLSYRVTPKKKKYLKFYLFILIAVSSIIGLLNDNKMFYFLLLLFLYAYFVFHNPGIRIYKTFQKYVKIIGITLLCLMTVLLLYPFNPFVHYTVQRILQIVNRCWQAFFGAAVSYQNQGSIERVYMIVQAFTKFNGLTTGLGIGTYSWHAGKVMGFLHFGQSDLGAFLCLGGVWFTGLVIILYLFLYRIITRCKRSIWKQIILLFLICFIAFYTQSFSITTLQTAFGLNIMVLGFIMDERMQRSKVKRIWTEKI